MRVARWGNSLAVRLPASLVEALSLKEGDEIELNPGPHRRLSVSRDPRIDEAIARIEALAKPTPAGWRFDREEANER